MADPLAGWLLTYGLHSLVACVVALVAGRFLIRSPAERTTLWKFVLVAPLLTATLSLAFVAGAVSRAPVSKPAWVRTVSPVDLGAVTVAVESVRTGSGPERRTERVDDLAARLVTNGVIGFALLTGLLAAVRAGRRYRRLARELANRRRTTSTELGFTTNECLLADGSSVFFSVIDGCGGAMAIGGREICVGPNFLDLTVQQRRGVLAHEMAHLDRHDPRWVEVADWVAALGAFQPLAAVVATRLRRDAEFACDDAAVQQVGEPRSLAESLAVMAAPFDSGSTRVVAVGYAGSPLVQRVQRILSTDGASSRSRPQTVGTVACMLLLGGLLLATPSLSAAPSPDDGADGTTLTLEETTRFIIR